MSFSLSNPAPAMIGAAIKNEKFAASSRRSPKARAAVMVTPERDTPGTIANACERPMRKASKTVISPLLRISTKDGSDDREPFAPVEDKQGYERAHVERDVEGEAWIFPSGQPREERQMGRTRDWKELG